MSSQNQRPTRHALALVATTLLAVVVAIAASAAPTSAFPAGPEPEHAHTLTSTEATGTSVIDLGGPHMLADVHVGGIDGCDARIVASEVHPKAADYGADVGTVGWSSSADGFAIAASVPEGAIASWYPAQFVSVTTSCPSPLSIDVWGLTSEDFIALSAVDSVPAGDVAPAIIDRRLALNEADSRLIAGGAYGTFSYAVAFGNCSGSLISAEWVLSAEHCAPFPSQISIGGVPATTDYHEIVAREFDGDIVLVHLAEPSSQAPVAWNGNRAFDDEGPARAIGYGLLCATCSPAPTTPRWVDLPITPPSNQRFFINAGERRSYEGICFGDSGGPLVKFAADGQAVQIGVHSFLRNEPTCSGRSGHGSVAHFAQVIEAISGVAPWMATSGYRSDFACSSDAGALTWTDVGAERYWVYKSTDGGATYQWLAGTTATSFTDQRPLVGGLYQVHHAGIGRTACTVVRQPSLQDSFHCTNDAGTITWNDVGGQPYWIYRIEAAGAEPQWMATKSRSVAVVDPNPKPGVRYEAHYPAIGRVTCETVREPASQAMTCSVAGATLTWNDQGAERYWIYRATPGQEFAWIGNAVGSTTFTDAASVPGARYQLHYPGAARLPCQASPTS